MRGSVIKAFRGLENAGEGAFSARFRFAPDAPLFQGHFPGMPILPAVVQVEMARYVAETATAARHRVLEVQRAKFTAEIRPAEDIVVDVKLETTDGLRVAAAFKVAGEVKSTMTLVLAAMTH